MDTTIVTDLVLHNLNPDWEAGSWKLEESKRQKAERRTQKAERNLKPET